MTKQELRKEYREKRKLITPSEKLKMDDLMLMQLQDLDFNGVETLMSYWPLNDYAEPNTHIFTQYVEFLIPELKVCYPKTDFTDNSMQAVLTTDETVFAKNEKGLEEPKDGKIITKNNIDLVFVPMFVCDAKGYRVGFGKGFYDRFLADDYLNMVMIGFSYFDPVESIDDVNEFDIPLDICITPHNIYNFE